MAAGPFVSSGDTNQKHTISRSPVWFDLGNFIRPIPCGMDLGLVYLTWIELCCADQARKPAADPERTARISIKLMCISLYDVNSSDWTVKRDALDGLIGIGSTTISQDVGGA